MSFIRNHHHSVSASAFSETFQNELPHMFAISYAVNHAGRGVDTGHGSPPALVFFLPNVVHIDAFLTTLTRELSVGKKCCRDKSQIQFTI